MPNIALNPRNSVLIDVLSEVDGYPDITHKLSLSTGSAPLESGATITDHAVSLPEKLSLSGWVSDLGPHSPSEAWEQIRGLNKRVEPIEVFTPWAVYREMLITSVTAVQSGAGMKFSMDLETVLRVGVSSATITTVDRGIEIIRGRIRVIDEVIHVTDSVIDSFIADIINGQSIETSILNQLPAVSRIFL